MRQDQVALQFFQLVVGDSGFRKQAESCVDAIGGVAARQNVADCRLGGAHCRVGGGVQFKPMMHRVGGPNPA